MNRQFMSLRTKLCGNDSKRPKGSRVPDTTCSLADNPVQLSVSQQPEVSGASHRAPAVASEVSRNAFCQLEHFKPNIFRGLAFAKGFLLQSCDISSIFILSRDSAVWRVSIPSLECAEKTTGQEGEGNAVITRLSSMII